MVDSPSSSSVSVALASGLVRAEHVDDLVGRVRSDWVRGYIAAKRRGQLGRKVPKEVSLYAYVKWIKRAEDLGLPDLAICSLEELGAFLVTWTRGHGEYFNFNLVGVIKEALKYLKRHDLNENIKRPPKPDPRRTVKDKIIPETDIKRLVDGAPTLRDRLLVQVFWELGSRRGEMWRLRIKDVQFDEYGAILTLDGKSGIRRRRIYNSIPDLRTWLNNHPMKNDPFAPLFLTAHGTGFVSPQGITQAIKRLSKRVLGRYIHPHQFRHTRATQDSLYFTDREMMKLYGWTTPDMVAVYSHLSMRDVENHDLILHGLKPRDETLRQLVQIQECTSCGEENAPVAIYCVKCGAVLTTAQP